MKRTFLALVVTLALFSTVVAGSATAQASPALSAGDSVETISVQPDHLKRGGGSGGSTSPCAISPSNLDPGGGSC